MLSVAPKGDETAEISLERLHYGKLASGATLSVPATEGYGVTLRSRNLRPADDRLLSPPQLMALRRLEPDLVDPASRQHGAFLARVSPEPNSRRAVFLRARFRPEDGEGGHGRLYQQSAVWSVAAADWRRHPAALLAMAGSELEALPDLATENEDIRYSAAPARYVVRFLDPQDIWLVLEDSLEKTRWAAPVLEFLARGAETGEDATLTFGADDFASEAAFLNAIGLALQFLPASYPRWREISVVSGLRHAPQGLCFRYLPSLRAAAGATSIAA
ncbi:hypothetical protein [Methylocystis sp. B8]|uniref:hypothetical protein n=1 Tax=Methylocystis sp. B8 TaxID=544938 RepID=UPI0010FE3F33|nr:hypothetical protein [Methylocystis sp. B8]TLG78508.1 hypothetical protein FEV16_00200 [Methylocystis sp. B8]